MSDPLYDEFQGRVQRIEKMHRKGYAFEAPGTVGRSVYVRPTRQVSVTRPLMLVLATGLMLKASLMMYLGEADYAERVSRLQGGSQVEAVGAVIMQPDSVSRWLSEAVSGFIDDLV